MKGTIKVLKNGFGFIQTEEMNEDVFFHNSELEGVSFDELAEGNEVTFEIGDGKNGKKQGTNVCLAD